MTDINASLNAKVIDIIRKSGIGELSVDMLVATINRDGDVASRPSIVKALKYFQSKGYGEFINGRRGHASRFSRSAKALRRIRLDNTSDDHPNVLDFEPDESASVTEKVVAAPFRELARMIAADGDKRQTAIALRKLLEARNAAIRARSMAA